MEDTALLRQVKERFYSQLEILRNQKRELIARFRLRLDAEKIKNVKRGLE